MKGSKLQTRVFVHAGFKVYLFENNRMRGDQRFDGMVADIRATINGEEGYSVYITGHSLGGALATMFSMKVAGGGSSFNDIPRPITCIPYSNSFSGTQGYRTAMEHLEKAQLIRHLRITNAEDIVPAVVFFSNLSTTDVFGISIGAFLARQPLDGSSKLYFQTHLGSGQEVAQTQTTPGSIG